MSACLVRGRPKNYVVECHQDAKHEEEHFAVSSNGLSLFWKDSDYNPEINMCEI